MVEVVDSDDCALEAPNDVTNEFEGNRVGIEIEELAVKSPDEENPDKTAEPETEFTGFEELAIEDAEMPELTGGAVTEPGANLVEAVERDGLPDRLPGPWLNPDTDAETKALAEP